MCGLDASSVGQGPVVGFCEHSNEPSCFIKSWNLNLLLKKDSDQLKLKLLLSFTPVL
jgi:hypothetical protein